MKEQAKRKVELSRLGELALQAQRDTERELKDVPCVHSIPHHTLELIGSAGELAGIVQRVERGELKSGDALVRHRMAMALTEAFEDMLNVAALLDVDLEKTYMMVRANKERSRRGTNEQRA